MESTEKRCGVEGCKRPYRAKGYCNVHFRKWRKGELEARPRYRTCGEENCRKPFFKAGMCEQHYGAWLASKKGEGAVSAEVKPTEPAESAEAKEAKPKEAPAEEKKDG